MITLALETSTVCGSVAVLENEKTLFNDLFMANRSHSSLLFVSIERALVAAPRCDQIVVGLGPGSYSGVRIAVSAAIGLSLGTGAKLLGVPSIAAFNAEEYLAIGDARRGTFYFSHLRSGEIIEGPTLLEREILEEKIRATMLPVLASEQMQGFPNVTLAFPCAEKLARLAARGSSIFARDNLEPIYLRDPHITQPKKLK
jgi:tRNA threonylcarbamoyladenosine biosynthesis protein TsaB